MKSYLTALDDGSFMRVQYARSGSGIFNAEKMSVYVPLGTQQMLSDYGYHIVTE